MRVAVAAVGALVGGEIGGGASCLYVAEVLDAVVVEAFALLVSHALGEAVDDEPQGDVDGALHYHGVALISAHGPGALHVVAVARVGAYLLEGCGFGLAAYVGVGLDGLKLVVVADAAVVFGGKEGSGLFGSGFFGSRLFGGRLFGSGLFGSWLFGSGLLCDVLFGGEDGLVLGGVGDCLGCYHSMFLLLVLRPKEGVKLFVRECRCRREVAPSSASGASSWPRMPFSKARVWSRPRSMSGSSRCDSS